MVDQLNKEQHEAAYSNERTILCLAGAGCGKTKTLIHRIARQIKEGANPSSMLCLTFTNAAAFEMKERYKTFPGIDLSKGSPEFRTFHSFCYSLIVKDKAVRERLGYTKIPELCDDTKLKEIKSKVKLTIGCKLSESQLEADESMLTRSEKDEKALFQKAFIKEIKKLNVITFDMMCYNVGDLFIRNESCIEKYKQRYHYLYCDELQDTDSLQARFIASFPKTTNFFLVGDVLQNIYQFRNCTNDFIKSLVRLPEWKVIKMNTNYRSTIQICNYANRFSTYSKDDYRIEMKGLREGDPVTVIHGSHSSFKHPVDEDHLSQLVEKLKENKTETAILCRSNKECAAVRARLKAEGIEFSSRSKESSTLNYLHSALSNEYMLEWLSTQLEAKDYGDYIRLAAIEANPDIRWFLNMYSKNERIRSIAEKIIKIRSITSSKESPEEKFNQITSLLRVKSKCHFDGDVTWTNKKIVENIRDQVQELEDCQIFCGTVHSVKGLEYDTVYVMGVNDRMFRLGTEEMNNLFYVAATRAKNHLIVFRR